jgi:hypothetical protein
MFNLFLYYWLFLEPMCEIYEGTTNLKEPKYGTGNSKPNSEGIAQLTINTDVSGDVKIIVKDKQFKYHFWFNTAFIEVRTVYFIYYFCFVYLFIYLFIYVFSMLFCVWSKINNLNVIVGLTLLSSRFQPFILFLLFIYLLFILYILLMPCCFVCVSE